MRGVTQHAGIQVFTPLPPLPGIEPVAMPLGFRPIRLTLGLEPEKAARHGLSRPIPDRAKPSPLRFIYRNLVDPADRLDPAAVLFSFIDFDAY